MKLSYQSYSLKFKTPGGTSRGILTEKETFLFRLQLEDKKETEFFGEAALFRGLSAEDSPFYEEKLQWVCNQLSLYNEFSTFVQDIWDELQSFPSIQFALEQILQTYNQYAEKKLEDEFNPILFSSDFTEGKKGIPINGLIWMGDINYMKEQIQKKLNQNFHCLKLKIGVDWEMEKSILNDLRKEFAKQDLEIRVDANGGFNFNQAKVVLQELADLEIHSIEQPIKAGQIEKMAELCTNTPTPIALDEELIGVFTQAEKEKLIQKIKPQFIILKPSLVGGWKGSQDWIDLVEKQHSGWWVTSALESNIGLNAIAQWTFMLNNVMPQGLGTGSLFKNNFHSRLKVIGNQLFRI
ncbi:MAG: o-succinylbenzoate synthase [Moheibacter sp.]